MARDIEHFFMCFLDIWISSPEKFCPVLLPISNWVINFLGVYFLSSLYILVIDPLSDVELAKIFFHSEGSLLLLFQSFLIFVDHFS
jgi:hypothetical protein